ncbi:MAG: hypothetical protein ACO1O1_13055 [Adhaeribacter sp.]
MKKSLVYLSLLLGLLAGCDCEKDPKPDLEQEKKLLKISRSTGFYQFEYAPGGRLSQIQQVDRFVSGETFITTRHLHYDSQGRLNKIVSTGEDLTEYRYVYQSGKLIKLEEYLREQQVGYHLFTYDAKGRLASQVKAEKAGDLFEASWKYTYSYDSGDNLQLQAFYLAGNGDWHLDRTRRFDHYDNQVHVDQATDLPLLPGIRVHRNNPGKLTTWHASDGREVVATMAYTYTGQHYPEKKTTSSLHGTFDTHYTYQP